MNPDATREWSNARWAGICVRTLAWYLLAMMVLWAVGVEGIYGSPLPFYALFSPAFVTIVVPGTVVWTAGLILWLATPRLGRRRVRGLILWCVSAMGLAALTWAQAHFTALSFATLLGPLRWHALVLLVFFTGMAIARFTAPLWMPAESEPSAQTVRWFLVALMVFAFAFAGAVAMLRDGPMGISQAYQRHGYEYISDIGATSGIQALFRDFLKVRPYLSMHAKVHPPGPIALLWLISYGIGQDPLALSLATMAFGVLAIVPLYGWVADLAGRRTALACCVLYSLMPSIVLFTATSADILFMPFTLTTLFLFTRAIERRSALYALAAGAGFALMSILSFSLIAVGAF
ncbi:MAG: glycosyltransferase family 39 protein, partial [Candidatus Hydrogenedentes bacterium]|nr:glycosyltransferase family 39 protein [Candidatus Hydrogenedentota bacterium]